jgi:hypothetical protein
MSFTDTWNSTYEGVPADNRLLNLGAGDIRDFKVNIRQRVQVNHSFNGDANDGKHTIVELLDQSVPPPETANEIILWATDSGDGHGPDIYATTPTVTYTRLTYGGQIIPTGTVMLFMQSAAPLGWTQVTTVNDRVLRVVNDNTGGNTGGSWSISGLNAAVTVAGHSLTESELPSHRHGLFNGVGILALTLAAGSATASAGGTQGEADLYYTDYDGSNSAHGHAGSTATASGDGTWRPAYVNMLAASKV